MVSKRLIGVWTFLDLCLLAAGALSVALSIVWRAPDVLMNMVFSPTTLTAGLILGIFLLATVVISIGAIVQPNHVNLGLVILNWALIVDATVIVFIGSWIWFFTLHERNNFHALFLKLSVADRIILQDQFKCCGYFDANDAAEIGGTFCADQTFVTVTNNNATTGSFCVTPITAFADYSLNNTFTTIYGFMAIVIALFLASICVINKRAESERFKKIDAKRGGKGFV